MKQKATHCPDCNEEKLFLMHEHKEWKLFLCHCCGFTRKEITQDHPDWSDTVHMPEGYAYEQYKNRMKYGE